MEMEHQASVECEQIFHLENVIFNEGECAATTSSTPVKKQTRGWAAWTRKEEETFFSALRQSGKNFEKITTRVQTKNKDQVRHYYYRLVRRMNKFLGPDFCLDAKNSKDTNAAMLRWWSLLEKYSCKASKLHLKPRRFKIFVETLEQQLMRDRKKGKRKRISQEESCSPPPSSVTDPSAVKVLFVDKRNIQQLGTAKGSSLRRNGTIATNRNNCKGESSSIKKARQRRKPALTAAYKKWERAAFAGVSLVADAAEHLERAAEDNIVEILQNLQEQNTTEPVQKDALEPVQKDVLEPVQKDVLEPVQKDALEPVQKDVLELVQKDAPSFASSSQGPTKLKLQLFPIDEITRRALETDSHNPYLELTLSTRKKISSVLEHMNRKWGTSSIATGELILVPYFAQKETILNSQKWTADSSLTAADVYSLTGSPQIFRLRYCWLTDATSSPKNPPEHSGSGWTAGEWADSLTNISIGDLLLSSASPDMESVEQIPFTCDSFDAAVAAHIYKHRYKSNSFHPTLTSISSSILDADETCDGFTFNKNSAFSQKFQLRNDFPRPSEEVAAEILTDIKDMDEKAENVDDGSIPTTNGDPKDEIQPDRQSMDDPPKDLNALTDIYWPDSLGPLDLDIIQPTCRYHSEDLILTDSMGGLNRLIANSLDAFQNCSFFGLDKKETALTVEPQES